MKSSPIHKIATRLMLTPGDCIRVQKGQGARICHQFNSLIKTTWFKVSQDTPPALNQRGKFCNDGDKISYRWEGPTYTDQPSAGVAERIKRLRKRLLKDEEI